MTHRIAALLALLLPLAASCGPQERGRPLALLAGPQAIADGSNDLSALAWQAEANGWGPVERGRSNGERGADDGKPLTLNSVVYPSGLGVHAGSTVRVALDRKCATLTADVGVDDEVGARGSVTFQVFGDGILLFDSGRLTGASPTRKLSVSVQGVKALALTVTDAGDGPAFDHADWAALALSGCSAVVYDGPLTITKGGTYTGAWQSLDPTIPAVNVRTSEPVVIENCRLKGRYHLVQATFAQAQVTVRGCTGEGLNPGIVTRGVGRFVNASGVRSLVVERNRLIHTSGIYLYTMAAEPGPVSIRYNHATDIDGRFSDGQGGFQSRFYRVQFVQFNAVKGVSQAEIAWNRVENRPRFGHVEDVINIYGSTGVASRPIRIHHNLIRGAFAGDPSASYSGGGIMLGDGKGAYQEASSNSVLETSNYGVAVAEGNFMTVKDNTVLGTGRLSDGTLLDADSDAGIYLRDYNNDPAHITASVVASGNTVGWGTPTATGPNNRWDYSIDARAGSGVNNTRLPPGPINPALLDQAVADWEAAARVAGVTVGP